MTGAAGAGAPMLAFVLSAGLALRRARPGDASRLLLARERQRLVVRSLVESARGDCGEPEGDEVLARLPTATASFEVARRIQETLSGDRDIELQIGLHVGEVGLEEGRLRGPAAQAATRIRKLAPPGCIALSAEVYADLDAAPPARSLGRQALAGTQSVEVQVVEPEGPRRHPILRAEVVLGAAAVLALALFGWYQFATRVSSSPPAQEPVTQDAQESPVEPLED